ncbi:MAG: 2-C-methyl-D-erythritol 4-phosphate cytidylyltransferase [Ruminococcaceae bacterium]|nr:2-C-methyl-D-erythritol 4-phosphate cytidylyltransferase [Oscillospiraceae bacterium]
MNSKSNVYALILAGGKGSRMGNSEKPKQFLEICSKPIIIYTIEKFMLYNSFEKIIVLAPKQWVKTTEDIIAKYFPENDRIAVVCGGPTRNETILNGINYIEDNLSIDEDTIIVTHDAVRPFVTHRIITENIESAKKYGACDTVIPATDTIVVDDKNNFIDDIPDRSKMNQGQTPQSFKALTLKRHYQTLTSEEKEILTDACKIMLLKGEKVHLVQGEVFNIKITYPFDIKMATAILEG